MRFTRWLAHLISAIVLTFNEEEHLPDCLTSLQWADELLVFDSFSADRTCAIAEEYGARVLQHPFENYAAQRNAALDAVRADWVFFVDADERATPALAEEVRAVTQQGEPVGWWVPRHNYIFGRLTLHAGWYPDYQLRLMRPDRARYDPERHVHELAILQGPDGRLKQPLIHLNYTTVPEFIAKQHNYTRYDAGILHQQGQRARPHNFMLQPLRQFYWRFITLDGWRDGWHGLRLSALMGFFQVVLYRELWRLQRGDVESASVRGVRKKGV